MSLGVEELDDAKLLESHTLTVRERHAEEGSIEPRRVRLHHVRAPALVPSPVLKAVDRAEAEEASVAALLILECDHLATKAKLRAGPNIVPPPTSSPQLLLLSWPRSLRRSAGAAW